MGAILKTLPLNRWEGSTDPPHKSCQIETMTDHKSLVVLLWASPHNLIRPQLQDFNENAIFSVYKSQTNLAHNF